MADTSQVGLQEPDKMDWENYNPGSTFKRPPEAMNTKGETITYFGVLPTKVEAGVTDDGNRSWLLDPIKLAKNGAGVDGYEIRFTRVSTRKFTNKQGEPINASSVGNLLRSTGIQAKPQTNAEYDKAVEAAKNRIAAFTIEWEARNKDTGETVRGYANFPDDPDRPGLKKAILKKGDTYRSREGTIETVQSDVLFANARVRYFVDSSRKTTTSPTGGA